MFEFLVTLYFIVGTIISVVCATHLAISRPEYTFDVDDVFTMIFLIFTWIIVVPRTAWMILTDHEDTLKKDEDQ